MRRKFTVFVVGAALLVAPVSPSHALIGDIYSSEDSVDFEVCFSKKFAGARGVLEVTDGNGQWRRAEDDFSIMDVILDRQGCINETLYPAQYAEPDESQVAYRVKIPRQKRNGKVIPASSKHLDNFKVWHRAEFERNVPVPYLDAFAKMYGSSVVTVLCFNPRTGEGGQGSGFAVNVNLSPEAKSSGFSTYIVTAGHVLQGCNYRDYRDVTVIYQGRSYPGISWSKDEDPDIGTLLTSAPAPAAELADGSTNRPAVGDIGVAIGVAGGVVGTTSQGQIVGVSDKELNTTIPSGPGASGGPVFNNEGKVIGLIVAGSGSLTVATALPTFCGHVFVADPCFARW